MIIASLIAMSLMYPPTIQDQEVKLCKEATRNYHTNVGRLKQTSNTIARLSTKASLNFFEDLQLKSAISNVKEYNNSIRRNERDIKLYCKPRTYGR